RRPSRAEHRPGPMSRPFLRRDRIAGTGTWRGGRSTWNVRGVRAAWEGNGGRDPRDVAMSRIPQRGLADPGGGQRREGAVRAAARGGGGGGGPPGGVEILPWAGGGRGRSHRPGARGRALVLVFAIDVLKPRIDRGGQAVGGLARAGQVARLDEEPIVRRLVPG